MSWDWTAGPGARSPGRAAKERACRDASTELERDNCAVALLVSPRCLTAANPGEVLMRWKVANPTEAGTQQAFDLRQSEVFPPEVT